MGDLHRSFPLTKLDVSAPLNDVIDWLGSRLD
jgi:hypothetical protein